MKTFASSNLICNIYIYIYTHINICNRRVESSDIRSRNKITKEILDTKVYHLGGSQALKQSTSIYSCIYASE